MTLSDRLTHDDRLLARRYDYPDATVFVIDVSHWTTDVDIDVVDDTAILVLDAGDDTEQHEIELPDGDATAFINNGVVTIEVRE
ncbi:MAG: hypothetical protein ABEJ57_04430 [Halobacteriaceae archaeon]